MTGKPLPGKVIAITGGLACGKSTVGRLLEENGFETVDADQVAHTLMSAGSPVNRLLSGEFGPGILAGDGSVNRKALAAIVFHDPGAMARLNAIVHPPVRSRIEEWVGNVRSGRTSGAAQVPLLFEAGMDDMGWDAIWVVAARPETVISRLRLRGIEKEEALRRLAAQWPLEEKTRRATQVIHNNGSPAELADTVREQLRALQQEKKQDE
jgi:dephospho-CoA kinase